MTIIKRLKNYLLLLTLTVTLVGCGVESTDLPPERPVGYVSGYAIDSAISNAIVSVYSFANGQRGERLGVGLTNGVGAFSVNVQAESQLVMVEITGGSYVEEASGVEVLLSDGQKLRSLIYYESGHLVSTNVTPLTHMATALAEYKIANGIAATQATSEAFDVIDQFFALNSRGITSTNITSENPSLTTLDTETLYGFYLAGLSSWTAWINKENNRGVHTTYTSINLTQRMYDDIRHDGLLNGLVSDTRGGSMQLVLENVTLSADAYRLAFSLHMLAVASNEQNKTGIDSQNQALIEAAQAIAAANDNTTLFPAGSDVPLSDPSFGVRVDESQFSGIYGRQYEFEIDVTSLLGAERIDIRLDDPQSDPIQTLLALDAPVANLQIDEQVAAGPNCTHSIYVTAVNILGDEAATEFNACFDWNAPTVEFDSEPYANTDAYTLEGSFQDNLAGLESVTVTLVQAQTGFEAVINPTNENATAGGWNVSIQGLALGENPLQIVVTDTVGNRFETTHSIYLDDKNPSIIIGGGEGHHGSVRYSDGSGGFSIENLQSIDAVNPLYIESNRAFFPVAANNTALLESNFIPFYRFTVSDERAPLVYAEPSTVTVELKYEKGAGPTLMDDWHVISDGGDNNNYRNCDLQANTCEYYVPIASPFLNENWDKTTQAEVHTLSVRVSDAANNSIETQFQFVAGIVVPPIGPIIVEDLDPFTGNFDKRSGPELNQTSLGSTTYTFAKPTGKSMYIQLDEPAGSVHTVDVEKEQELRIHLVDKTTTTEWQIVRLTRTDANDCPLPELTGTVPEEFRWRSISRISNYISGEFVGEDVPPPVFENNISIQRNNASTLDQITDWQDKAHFDQEFQAIGNISYDYFNGGSFTYAVDTRTPATCQEQRFFQERQVISHDSVAGYPRDETTSLSPITAEFPTSGYVVTADGVIVSPLNGWYLIEGPEDIEVVITKNVLTTYTPALMFDDDDFDPNASYTDPSVRDTSVTRNIDRRLIINAVHNAGEANIVDMVNRAIPLEAGTRNYPVPRP